MSNTGSNAEDLIVATIRSLRRPYKSMHEHAKAGVGMPKVWRAVAERYTPKEFERAMNLLLQKQVVTLVCRYVQRTSTGIYVKSSYYLATSYPAGADPSEQRWKLDLAGNMLADSASPQEHISVVSRILYVVADGLPVSVTRLQQGRSGPGA